jgi:hypothetical protein
VVSIGYSSVLIRGLTGYEWRAYECAQPWVTDDIHIWIDQHSTSHYALSVAFCVARVDVNLEIHLRIQFTFYKLSC